MEARKILTLSVLVQIEVGLPIYGEMTEWFKVAVLKTAVA